MKPSYLILNLYSVLDHLQQRSSHTRRKCTTGKPLPPLPMLWLGGVDDFINENHWQTLEVPVSVAGRYKSMKCILVH